MSDAPTHIYIHTCMHTIPYRTIHYSTVQYSTWHDMTWHACIHTYIHTYMYTYIHVYIHTYMYVYIYMYILIYAQINMYVNTYIDKYLHVYCIHVYTCIHACIHLYHFMYMYTKICVFLHAWQRQHTSICTYVQSSWSSHWQRNEVQLAMALGQLQQLGAGNFLGLNGKESIDGDLKGEEIETSCFWDIKNVVSCKICNELCDVLKVKDGKRPWNTAWRKRKRTIDSQHCSRHTW